jgi:hypothetical protein
MLNLIANSQLPVFASHLSLYGFVVVALVLLVLVGFDMRRAARAASKKSSSMQFLSPYRDENGMPIFFDLGEDPSERSAQRVLTQKRRSNGAAK